MTPADRLPIAMSSAEDLRFNAPRLYFRIAQVALPLFFLADFANKVLYLATGNDNPPFSASQLVRMLFELLVLGIILARPDSKRILVMALTAILLVSFSIGLLFYVPNAPVGFPYYYHFALFNKYVFAFIVYAYLYSLRDEPALIGRLMKTCEYLFILNSILVLAGAIFELRLFRSYPFMDYRYGYNGVIPAVNESSFFYFIALSYLYYKKYILNERIGLLILVPLSAFFLGTKAIYVFMAALVLFHFFRVSSLQNKFLAFMGVVCFALLAWLLYESSYTQQIVEYFQYLIEKRGLVSAALSGRDEYVATKFFDNLEIWTPMNYLFGGQNQMTFLIEMDVFDGFLFFGLVGSAIWYFLLFNTVFSFSRKKKFNLFFIAIYLILAALGGHMFASAVNSLYLVIFCLFIYACDRRTAGMASN